MKRKPVVMEERNKGRKVECENVEKRKGGGAEREGKW